MSPRHFSHVSCLCHYFPTVFQTPVFIEFSDFERRVSEHGAQTASCLALPSPLLGHFLTLSASSESQIKQPDRHSGNKDTRMHIGSCAWQTSHGANRLPLRHAGNKPSIHALCNKGNLLLVHFSYLICWDPKMNQPQNSKSACCGVQECITKSIRICFFILLCMRRGPQRHVLTILKILHSYCITKT